MKQNVTNYLFLAAAVLLIRFGAVGQANPSLYDAFDNAIGRTNLNLNNGTIHLNNLRPANKSHRYYIADKYILGDIIYDAQPYNNRLLKYDLLNDIIIAKAEGENNTLGINLITAKTAAFSIYGKKFVNLNYENATPKFVNGFYEETIINSPITFYTKYRKDQIEVLRGDGVFYKFEESWDYVFKYESNYYHLDSKRDAVNAFPQLENDINAFYKRNTALERTDKTLFYKTLLTKISTLLPNETNLRQ